MFMDEANVGNYSEAGCAIVGSFTVHCKGKESKGRVGNTPAPRHWTNKLLVCVWFLWFLWQPCSRLVNVNVCIGCYNGSNQVTI